MELNVYSVLDLKTKAFTTPFYAKTRGEAIRSFTTAVNEGQKDNMWHKYPEDFALYEIGTWDDNLGQFSMKDSKDNLGLAIQFKRIEDENSTH
nr:MAG: nonstructural protein [Microvirus sp.]